MSHKIENIKSEKDIILKILGLRKAVTKTNCTSVSIRDSNWHNKE